MPATVLMDPKLSLKEVNDLIDKALQDGRMPEGWDKMPETAFQHKPLANDELPQQDHLVDLMKARNAPLTRENYLRLAYDSPHPKGQLPAEEEAQLPPEFRTR